MPARWLIAALLAAGLASAPAAACRVAAPAVLADVRHADAVVVGRVAGYTIVRNREFRRRMLQARDLPDDLRRIYADPNSILIGDYARFDVRVAQVLAGQAPRTLRVTWSNSTFGLPKSLPRGPLLIALAGPGVERPALSGPSTIAPRREPGLPAVLQAPCARPLMFAANSAEARAVRRILRERPARGRTTPA
jgi:ABC-type amino acid transport substrate-binding protein